VDERRLRVSGIGVVEGMKLHGLMVVWKEQIDTGREGNCFFCFCFFCFFSSSFFLLSYFDGGASFLERGVVVGVGSGYQLYIEGSSLV
jgi:hypothetical protein